MREISTVLPEFEIFINLKLQATVACVRERRERAIGAIKNPDLKEC